MVLLFEMLWLTARIVEMLGRKERRQPELFVAGSLRDLLPDDHVLVRVDRVLDLGWLHEEVAELYDASTGRPSIDPEVAVRLMLAGFLLGFVHDRRLMREAQVNLAIRWFCGYGLHEALPDHSSLPASASVGGRCASGGSSSARCAPASRRGSQRPTSSTSTPR